MRKVYRFLKLTERLAGAFAAWFEEFGMEFEAEKAKEQADADGQPIVEVYDQKGNHVKTERHANGI